MDSSSLSWIDSAYHPSPWFRPQSETHWHRSELGSLFFPGSIAVIGASRRKGAVGNTIAKNLLDRMNRNEIHLINPCTDRILGKNCFDSITDVKEKIDLAIICLKAEKIPEEIHKCLLSGIHNFLVPSSGFSELGEQGKVLEKQIKEMIGHNNVRLLGPNTLGFIVPRIGLDTTFIDRGVFDRPGNGKIALISQSGSLGVDLMQELSSTGSGMSFFIGLGNKLDISEIDILDILKDDPETQVISMYLENINDPNTLISVSRSVTKDKPVLVLKGGRSRKGRSAVGLHTGRLGGDHALISGIFQQAGMIEVRDEMELLDLSRAFETGRLPKGQRTLILTNGGGNGIIATDLFSENFPKIQVNELPKGIICELRSILPEYIVPSNPLDITSSASNKTYLDALRACLDDGDFDSVLLGITVNNDIGIGLCEDIGRISIDNDVPIVVYLKGQSKISDWIIEFTKQGIAAYPGIRRAVHSLGHLSAQGTRRF